MEKNDFVGEKPEKPAEQDKAGNRGIFRVIAMATLGIAAIVGTREYCTDEEFRTKANDIIERFHYEAMRQFG